MSLPWSPLPEVKQNIVSHIARLGPRMVCSPLLKLAIVFTEAIAVSNYFDPPVDGGYHKVNSARNFGSLGRSKFRWNGGISFIYGDQSSIKFILVLCLWWCRWDHVWGCRWWPNTPNWEKKLWTLEFLDSCNGKVENGRKFRRLVSRRDLPRDTTCMEGRCKWIAVRTTGNSLRVKLPTAIAVINNVRVVLPMLKTTS